MRSLGAAARVSRAGTVGSSLARGVVRRLRSSVGRDLADERITMGRMSYGRPSLVTFEGEEAARVVIGDFCSIADGVEFMPGGNHRLDRVTTFPFRRMLDLDGRSDDAVPIGGPVEVGSDVYIGRGVKVLGTRRIGHGSVIGAYSVVTRDVEPYEIVAGAPARHLRYRVDADTRRAMLDLAWWEWDDDTIRARLADMTSPDVEAFVRSYRSLAARDLDLQGGGDTRNRCDAAGPGERRIL